MREMGKTFRHRMSWAAGIGLAGALLAFGGEAGAQAPAAPPPGGAAPAGQPPPGATVVVAPPGAYPPGYVPPPGGYPPPAGGYPPPGAGYPPPGAGYPPQGPGYFQQGTLAPRELDWAPGEPVPPGYRPSTKIRTGLVIGGAVTLGAVWLLNVATASIAVSVDSNGSVAAPLFAPVVGPFIAIGTLHANALGGFWLAFDGVVQAAGAAMLIAGIAAPKTILQRTDIVSK